MVALLMSDAEVRIKKNAVGPILVVKDMKQGRMRKVAGYNSLAHV